MTDGLVVVDKPAGWTSHDVVARCRRVYGQKRVGHAGTLDPDATGVLLVGLGRATRLLRFLTALPKTYVGEVVLGIATSTLDASGEVTGRWDMSAVGLDDVRTVAAGFVGAIRQVPPMVSAVHVAGRRLHELARAGIEVERKGREVHVHRLAVEPLYEAGGAGDGFAGAGEGRGYGSSGCPAFRMEVECSSGTYVRTLAADIGAALGGGAHLRRLRRTAVGSFTTADAVALEALGPEAVLSPAEALRDYPAVTVGDAAITDASHGRPLDVSVLGALTEPPWVVHDGSGALVAVYEAGTDGRARAAVVLAPAG